jgi:hypothetical protein
VRFGWNTGVAATRAQAEFQGEMPIRGARDTREWLGKLDHEQPPVARERLSELSTRPPSIPIDSNHR